MIFVKVCGVTSPAEAAMVAHAGADAVGLNLFQGPRKISPSTGDTILSALPPGFSAWVLVDVSGGDLPVDVGDLLQRHRVRRVQMYGAVTPETVRRLRGQGYEPVWVVHVTDRAFAARAGEFLDQCGQARPACVLLDAADATLEGGTGRRVDWDMIGEVRRAGGFDGWPPILLAGGLQPENIAAAIEKVEPWGVDVSSGVESSVARKDAEKVRAFVVTARGGKITPDTTP